MNPILIAMLALAGLLFKWWRASGGGDQEPANELAGDDAVPGGVPVLCLWCYREAARILRPAVGSVDDAIVCRNCGKALQFITNDGNGRWRIS